MLRDLKHGKQIAQASDRPGPQTRNANLHRQLAQAAFLPTPPPDAALTKDVIGALCGRTETTSHDPRLFHRALKTTLEPAEDLLLVCRRALRVDARAFIVRHLADDEDHHQAEEGHRDALRHGEAADVSPEKRDDEYRDHVESLAPSADQAVEKPPAADEDPDPHSADAARTQRHDHADHGQDGRVQTHDVGTTIKPREHPDRQAGHHADVVLMEGHGAQHAPVQSHVLQRPADHGDRSDQSVETEQAVDLLLSLQIRISEDHRRYRREIDEETQSRRLPPIEPECEHAVDRGEKEEEEDDCDGAEHIAQTA